MDELEEGPPVFTQSLPAKTQGSLEDFGGLQGSKAGASEGETGAAGGGRRLGAAAAKAAAKHTAHHARFGKLAGERLL